MSMFVGIGVQTIFETMKSIWLVWEASSSTSKWLSLDGMKGLRQVSKPYKLCMFVFLSASVCLYIWMCTYI